MAGIFKHSANQVYLSVIPAGIAGWLLLHGYRYNEEISKFYTWRSKVPVPDNIIDALDVEFTKTATDKNKKIRTGKFQISLIDNLEARTYGSFYLNPGAEFQVPVISTIENVNELKKRYPNLVDSIKELNLKADINIDVIPDKKLELILLNDSARYFFLRREILQAESFSHMVIPVLIGSASFLTGYPVFKVLQLGAGPWGALVITACFAAYITYRLLLAEKKQRILSMDKRILEEDKTLLNGAKEYFKARIAFGKIINEFGDLNIKKQFDEKGNCTSQQAAYTERLKQVLEIENKQISKANIRNL